jgi:chemotaxis protein MotB
MKTRKSVVFFLFMSVLIITSGCGMKQLREENEQLKEEVARLQQVERDYGDKLQQVERLSEEEKAALRTEMSEMRARLDESLQEQITQNEALVQKVKDLTVVEIGEAALFGSGQADLTPSGAKVIRQMTEVLRQYPDYHIRVEGHTDSVPIGEKLKSQFASNWELSTARATTVIRYMIHGLGMDPDRLSAVGYAQFRPITSNDTQQGRAKNRRIRMVVFKMIGEQSTPSE